MQTGLVLLWFKASKQANDCLVFQYDSSEFWLVWPECIIYHWLWSQSHWIEACHAKVGLKWWKFVWHSMSLSFISRHVLIQLTRFRMDHQAVWKTQMPSSWIMMVHLFWAVAGVVLQTLKIAISMAIGMGLASSRAWNGVCFMQFEILGLFVLYNISILT